MACHVLVSEDLCQIIRAAAHLAVRISEEIAVRICVDKLRHDRAKRESLHVKLERVSSRDHRSGSHDW